MKTKLTIILTLIMALSFGSMAMADGTFELLPFPDSFFPSAMQLSFDGSALVGWGNNYWTPETGYLTVDGGQVSNISGNGQVVIGTYMNPADGLNWAATWTVADGWSLMDYLPGGEGCNDWGSGYAGSFDGTQATGLAWVPSCKAEAFKWTQGVGTLGLGRPSEDRSSRGTDISDDGSMVVGFAEAPFGNRRPAFWTDDVTGPQVITADPAIPGELLGVNSDGTAACGTMNNEAMYWDPVNGIVPIGALPGEFNGSTATSISDDGKVVGFSGDPFFSFPTAIIWTVADGLMPIADYFATFNVPTPEGFHYYSCSAVSADGMTFVGAGIQDGGFFYSPWMVRLDENVVAAYLANFDLAATNGGVNLSFQVNADVIASDFELVARFEGMEWNVPIVREGLSFVATDNTSELRQGGTATYSLYMVQGGERTLLTSETVTLDGMPALVSQLKGAYPNPFNPMTKVAFTLAEAGHVQLAIYDAAGRRVSLLASEEFGVGEHTVTWEGRDDSGRALASGTYFVQMTTGSLVQQQKVNLVK